MKQNDMTRICVVDTIPKQIIQKLVVLCHVFSVLNYLKCIHCCAQDDVDLLATFHEVLGILLLEKPDSVIGEINQAKRQCKANTRAQYSV